MHVNIADPQTISTWAQMLIAPISLLIALIALRGYIMFRSQKSLLLALAFFMLAGPSLLQVLAAAGLFHWPTRDMDLADYIVGTIRLLDLISLFRMAGFVLLAVVYFNELKDRTVELTRVQLNVMVVALTAAALLSTYLFLYPPGGSAFGHPLLPFFSTTLSILLAVVIITFLFSYARKNGNINAFIAMLGFLLVLLNVAYGAISYDDRTWANGGDWTFAVMSVVALVGFVAFLVAIIRARVVHER